MEPQPPYLTPAAVTADEIQAPHPILAQAEAFDQLWAELVRYCDNNIFLGTWGNLLDANDVAWEAVEAVLRNDTANEAWSSELAFICGEGNVEGAILSALVSKADKIRHKARDIIRNYVRTMRDRAEILEHFRFNWSQ